MKKKIPYGLPNFELLRNENYAYVDKTRFIEMLENENAKYHFLIRPRKFGKSLFLSTLRHYYSISSKDKFDKLFGDLYIGKHPTPKQNSCFVIKFSFSGLDTSSVDDFKVSFTSAIQMSIMRFFTENRFLIKDYQQKEKELWNFNKVRDFIEHAFKAIENLGRKACIIIDEYDHFANDLIAQGTNLSIEQYKELIWANGVVRDFYETLKDNTETVIDTIFITGITPIMLDDVTSGFNISNNISNDVRYSEILGFTEEDVEFLIDECSINRSLLTIDRKFLYDGYLFHEEAEKKLYNPAMMLYFMDKTVITNGKLKKLIDDNLKIDYGRINMLLNKTENIEKLENILKIEKIQSEVITRFPVEKIHDSENFISLLYYMGMLTIDKDINNNNPLLRIPNYTIKTMYWEYIRNILKTQKPQLSHNEISFYESLNQLSFYNKYEDFIKFIHDFYVSRFSNRDFIRFDEKYIKAVILTLIFQSNYYLPISEIETSGGYSDIYLKRRNNLYPNIKNDWILEIKYIKQNETKKSKLIELKKNEAKTQLMNYKNSTMFKDRDDVKYLAVVFIGKKEYWIEEVC